MLLFPAYAIFVWYFCVRFRRQVWGFVALAFGLTLVAMLAILQKRLLGTGHTDGFIFSHLDFLLWLEFAAIGAIGLFMVCLPTHRAEVPCRGCGYELEGLEDANPLCPECGLAFAARKPRHVRCGACGVKSLMDPERPRCRGCEAHEHGAAARGDGVAAV